MTIQITTHGMTIYSSVISTLSFIGIVFLVAVVAALINKTASLSKQINNFRNNVNQKAENFVQSDQYNNFRDQVVSTSENAWNNMKNTFAKDDQYVENMYNHHPDDQLSY